MTRVMRLMLALTLSGVAAAETRGLEASGEPGSLERSRAIVELFQARFGHIGPQLADNLDQLYTEDIRFRDPITAVSGLPNLKRYLEHFGDTAKGARFRITDTVIQPGNAVVFWTMVMPDDGDEPGRQIDGVSHLRVRDRVYEERDYFDLGEVYEQVPVVGWFTGLVKSRLAPDLD